MKNRKVVWLIIGIVSVALIALAITYAYWQITKTQQGVNEISTACLDISLVDAESGNTGVTLQDQYPLNDAEGASLKPYKFTVTNNCDTEVNYQIALESIGDSTNAISASSIKIMLDDSTAVKLNSNKKLTPTLSAAYESHKLGVGTLQNSGDEGSSVTHELRLWIDEDAPVTEINKSFTSKVSVSIGQNIPDGILINNNEQLYALQRVLAASYVRESAGLTEKSYYSDFELFPHTKKYNTTEEKIEYLRTANFILNSDLTVKFARTDSDNFFLSIGSYEYPFAGEFYGNNHTVTLEGGNLNINGNFDNNLGLFGYIGKGSVSDLNIKVNSNIVADYSVKDINFGLLAGSSENAKFENIKVSIDNNATVGVDYQNASYRGQPTVAGVVAVSVNSDFNNVNLDLKNGSSIILNNSTADENSYFVGGIIGASNNNNIQNSRVKLTGSNLTANFAAAKNVYLGGIVGKANFTEINNCDVELVDGSIGTNLDSGLSLNGYDNLAVGGIVGFGVGGSSNDSETTGVEGVKINNSNVTINNSSQKNSVFAIENNGGGVNAGGIMGIAFNNASVINSSVNIVSGNIIATRNVENTTQTSYGAHSGGIVGRLEHTGKISGCSVVGDNMLIKSTGGEKNNYAGGIVGYDVGPFHRNVISLENNTVNGNNTSHIELALYENNIEQNLGMVGGIAGHSAYISKNNHIFNTNLKISGGHQSLTNNYIGKLFGAFNYNYLWRSGDQTYFTPDETRGIINSKYEDVNIMITDAYATEGDIYGYYTD